MKITTGFAPVILAFALSAPGAVAAQNGNVTQMLQDGRTIVVAAETTVCGRASPFPDACFAVALQFDCRHDGSGFEDQYPSAWLANQVRPRRENILQVSVRNAGPRRVL